MSEENAIAVSTVEPVSPPVVESVQNSSEGEKVFRQSDVNEVVQKRLSEAKQKYQQEGYERARTELAAQNMANQGHSSNNTAQSYAQSNASDDDRIRKIVAEQQENLKTQGVIDHALNTFRTRVHEGFSDPEYPDYKDTVEVLNTEAMTPVALLSSTFENTKDIIYHLGKDSAAAGTILNLMQNPATVSNAQRMLADISRQLSQNKAAKTAQTANAPLSQVNSSTTGVDSGSLTHAERRKKPSLRC